jgi:hypothetical protein
MSPRPGGLPAAIASPSPASTYVRIALPFTWFRVIHCDDRAGHGTKHEIQQLQGYDHTCRTCYTRRLPDAAIPGTRPPMNHFSVDELYNEGHAPHLRGSRGLTLQIEGRPIYPIWCLAAAGAPGSRFAASARRSQTTCREATRHQVTADRC